MKKQLFTLALLTLGYVASSHGALVAAMAHMNKFNETMAVGETQMVRGVDVRIISQTPAVPGETVFEVDEIVSGPNTGKWIFTTKAKGTGEIEIDKTIGGHHPSKKVRTAKHTITVIGAKTNKKRRVSDEDGLVVDSIQSVVSDEGIVVDQIEMDSVTTNSDSDMEMDAEGEVKDDVVRDVE